MHLDHLREQRFRARKRGKGGGGAEEKRRGRD